MFNFIAGVIITLLAVEAYKEAERKERRTFVHGLGGRR